MQKSQESATNWAGMQAVHRKYQEALKHINSLELEVTRWRMEAVEVKKELAQIAEQQSEVSDAGEPVGG